MTLIAPLYRPLSHTARQIGALACDALSAEIMLAPKPGLVTPQDRGSHDDMDLGTFLASIAALEDYFPVIAQAGLDDHDFDHLQILGIDAEKRMLAATGGVNTHRGAIFCLGLLAAAAGWAMGRGRPVRGVDLGGIVARRWGDAIALAGGTSTDSNGARAVRRHGVRGARDEAAEGFPTLTRLALPCLRHARAQLGPEHEDQALVQTLFTLMSQVQDTNVLHRGGAAGLARVQDAARGFLAAGGIHVPHWRDNARRVEILCTDLWLSPGGSADLLAAAWFLDAVEGITS